MKIKLSLALYFIIFLMFPLLLVDSLNGYLIENAVNFPISVSQLYKLIVICFILIVLFFRIKYLFYVVIAFLLLLTPSLVRVIKEGFTDYSFLVPDIIKIFKYITPLIAFFFFKICFKQDSLTVIKAVQQFIVISYLILTFNLLVSFVGIGYPMYEYGDVGTRGFFAAGNELSALLLILFSIIAYQLWNFRRSKLLYIIFVLFNVFLGLLISSKTGILGTFLVGILIPINIFKIKFKKRQLKYIFLAVTIVVPVTIYLIYRTIMKSEKLIIRLTYFWEKLDALTFIFSSRNLYVERMIPKYKENFTLLEKLIGGGQSYYQTILGDHIIEIDPIDIYLAYGFIGLLLLTGVFYFFFKNLSIYDANQFPYKKLSSLIAVMLLVLSCLSGHILNSGIAGIYIGLVFSLFYMREKHNLST